MRNSKAHKFNWKSFVAGMGAIVLGYLFLSTGNITIAPLLLVIGYCVLIPVAFL